MKALVVALLLTAFGAVFLESLGHAVAPESQAGEYSPNEISLEVRIRDGGENRLGGWLGEPLRIVLEITATSSTERITEMRAIDFACPTSDEMDDLGINWVPISTTTVVTHVVKIPNFYTYVAGAQVRSETGALSEVECDDALMEGFQRPPTPSPSRTPGPTPTASQVNPPPLDTVVPSSTRLVYLPALANQGPFEAVPPPATTPSATVPSATAPPTATNPPPTSVPTPVIDETTYHYVSATATESGDGSFDNPWPLQVALNHPSSLKPGDTVWLRAGTYAGTELVDTSLGSISFVCKTQGSEGAPIIFRNYQDERATLDGENNTIVLFVQNCSHTWFWGLEVMSSAPVRTPNRSFIYVTAPDVKFINMLLHDMADGIDLWTAAINAELYGSILYHNGWDESNGGHGHGIYTQNGSNGSKRIQDNIFFSQYGYNVKVWSTNQSIDNYDIQRNILFNGGGLAESTSRKFNFFVVGNNPNSTPRNLLVKDNYTFAGRTTTTPACNAFGPNYGVTDLRLEDNYLLGQFRVTGPYVDSNIAGNKIMGGTALPFITGPGYAIEDFPDNHYSQELPTEGVESFVLPNKYEAGRANIAIYNWAGADTVRVDVSGIGLAPGDRYELVQVMDYWRDIVTGTLGADGVIEVPMTGHSFEQAIGSTKAPVSQFPEFGAFVIRRAATSLGRFDFPQP